MTFARREPLAPVQLTQFSFPAVCWVVLTVVSHTLHPENPGCCVRSRSSSSCTRSRQCAGGFLSCPAKYCMEPNPVGAACAQVILYSFPAVCWVYGAGWVFSAFVSVVFWGASAQQLWEALRRRSTIVRPMGLQVRPPMHATFTQHLGSCCGLVHT